MTKLIGYGFLVLGVALLLLGIQQFGVYLRNPDQFPIYAMLTSLPEADRTMRLSQGSMVLPVGFFRISGMLSILLSAFLLVAVVKLLISSGVQMIRANTRDLAGQLIAEIRRLDSGDSH